MYRVGWYTHSYIPYTHQAEVCVCLFVNDQAKSMTTCLLLGVVMLLTVVMMMMMQGM